MGNINLSKISDNIEKGKSPIDMISGSCECIGDGSERKVFNYGDNKVIKLSRDYDNDINQNVREFDFYNRISDKDIKKKFARMYKGDPNSYIIQEYVHNVGEVLPQEIDVWVSDVEEFGIEVHDRSPENFGYRGSQVVMIDYAGCFLSK